jgi:hypothetical protein
MSIDSQIREMEALAQREGLLTTDTKYESKSAKESGHRILTMSFSQSSKMASSMPY